MPLNQITEEDVSGTSLSSSHGHALQRINSNISKTNEQDTSKWSQGTEITLKVYIQDTEPVLAEDHKAAIWIDSNDSDRVYLVFRRGSGDQVSAELS